MVDQVSIFTAFLAGIVSFLSPCVLPLVPGYLSFVSGVSMDEMRAEDRKADASRAIVVNTLFFVLGFSIVFVAMGAAATVLGGFLLENLPILGRIAGVIVILFGLHLTGLLPIKWLYQQMKFHGPANTRGPLGALLLGLAFAAGWTPCIGPILAGILALGAGQDTVWQGMGLLTVYSAGLGVPFLLTGLATQRFLGLFDAVKRHMRIVEMVGGVMLIAIGIMMVTDNFYIFQRWFSFLNRFAI
jgi:cytochrome c-type biogenesis protein